MSKEAKVGALVLFFFIVALSFIVWIKGNPFRKDRSFKVLFPNVHGLSVGSPVEYAGYDSGKVKSFSVTSSGILTEILINKPEVKIHEGDKFLIVPSSTIASEYQIFIVPNIGPSNEIMAGETTIIGQTAPGMQDFLFQAEDALTNLSSIMRKMESILGSLELSVNEINPLFKEIGKVARDGTIKGIASDLKSSARSIEEASRQTQQIVKVNGPQVQKIIRQMDNLSSSLKLRTDAINPQDLREISRSLKKTSSNLEAISSSVSPAEVKADLKVFSDTAKEAKVIMSKLQSPDPNEDVPTLARRTLQRADRISAGLESSLKNKSLLRTLFTKVPIKKEKVIIPAPAAEQSPQPPSDPAAQP